MQKASTTSPTHTFILSPPPQSPTPPFLHSFLLPLTLSHFSLSCTLYCCRCTPTVPPSAFRWSTNFTLYQLPSHYLPRLRSIFHHFFLDSHSLLSLWSSLSPPFLTAVLSPSHTSDSPRLQLVHSFISHCQRSKCITSLYPLLLFFFCSFPCYSLMLHLAASQKGKLSFFFFFF